jgi:hypothetical protein
MTNPPINIFAANTFATLIYINGQVTCRTIVTQNAYQQSFPPLTNKLRQYLTAYLNRKGVPMAQLDHRGEALTQSEADIKVD